MKLFKKSLQKQGSLLRKGASLRSEVYQRYAWFGRFAPSTEDPKRPVVRSLQAPNFEEIVTFSRAIARRSSWLGASGRAGLRPAAPRYARIFLGANSERI